MLRVSGARIPNLSNFVRSESVSGLDQDEPKGEI